MSTPGLVFGALFLGASAFAVQKTASLSPYDVVVPSINGEPSETARVAGQMFFDTSASAFKAVDNVGAVRTITTSAPVAPKGAKVTPSMIATNGSWTTVAFTSSNTEFDTGNFVGTNKFVVGASGIHTITAYAISTTESVYTGVRYRVNGGDWIMLCLEQAGPNNYANCSGSDPAMLAANDEVDFEVIGSFSPGNVNNIRLSIVQQF